MFFGGWLYPDAAWVGVVAAEVTSNEKDALDCAAMGPDVAQASSVPTKKKCKAFRIGISSLRFKSPRKDPRWWTSTGEKSYVRETGKSTNAAESAGKELW
jgi:hypothetical protein